MCKFSEVILAPRHVFAEETGYFVCPWNWLLRWSPLKQGQVVETTLLLPWSLVLWSWKEGQVPGKNDAFKYVDQPELLGYLGDDFFYYPTLRSYLRCHLCRLWFVHRFLFFNIAILFLYTFMSGLQWLILNEWLVGESGWRWSVFRAQLSMGYSLEEEVLG